MLPLELKLLQLSTMPHLKWSKRLFVIIGLDVHYKCFLKGKLWFEKPWWSMRSNRAFIIALACTACSPFMNLFSLQRGKSLLCRFFSFSINLQPIYPYINTYTHTQRAAILPTHRGCGPLHCELARQVSLALPCSL